MSEIKKYDYIDSLRGLAILGVIFVHTSKSITSLNPIILSICNFGKHGVQLFFVLSAYTLCLSTQNRKSEQHGKKSYFIRRFFRIAPLYYFGIVLYGIVFILRNSYEINTFLVKTNYSVYSVINHFTFTQGLSKSAIFAVVPGGWSIGAEMLFYIAFPFLFDMYFKISKQFYYFILPLFIAAIVFVFFRALPHLFPPLSSHDFNFYYCTIINQIPIFLTGMSLYFLSQKLVFDIKNRWIYLISFSLIIVVLNILYYYKFQDITLFPFAVAVSMAFLFMTFKSFPKLNIGILRLLGKMSYSIYLFHFIFSWWLSAYINENLNGHLNSSVILAICLITVIVCSLIMASITKYLIEDKGIDLGNRIIKRYIYTQNA